MDVYYGCLLMLLDIYSKNDASIIYPGLLASYLQVICRYVFSLLSKHPQETIVINKLLYPPLTASHRCMLWTGMLAITDLIPEHGSPLSIMIGELALPVTSLESSLSFPFFGKKRLDSRLYQLHDQPRYTMINLTVIKKTAKLPHNNQMPRA